jgi:hypothetical protein
MSSRPVDKQRKSAAMGHGQQAIWDEIRRLKTFTITDIWGVVDMHRKSIINYVKRLQAGGYVAQADDFDKSYKYALIKDAGVHAPRLTREGKAVSQGNGNQNMWRAMRGLREFSPLDLTVHSNTDSTTVTLTTAKAYCMMLMKAGYFRVVQKAKPPLTPAKYRLIRDTGPKAPQIQRVKQVFDPNLNEVTYYPGAQS